MKAVVLPSNLSTPATQVTVYDRVPMPVLLPSNTAIVKVVRAAINPVDNLLALGVTTRAFGWKQPFPYIAGEDFSGIVHAVSEDVTNVKVGDAVFASNWGQGRHDDLIDAPIVGGAFAEYMLIHAHKLSLKPSALSHAQAACIGIPATTAYECLFQHGKVTAGSKVLILGASSAVGQFAVQFAKNAGAFVAGTVSSRALSFVEQNFQYDVLINYNEQDWSEVIRDYDVVFDCVGEKNGLQRAKNGAVKPDGIFVTIADFSIGLDPKAYPPLTFGAAICFLQNTATQDTIANWIAEGKVKTFVDQEFDFTGEGVHNLYAKIIEGKSLGKNLLKVSDDN